MEGKFKLFVVTAIIILGISVAGVAFFLVKQMNEKSVTTPEATMEGTLNLVEISMGDAIMTNIAISEDEIQHFAKIKISLGISDNNKKAYEAFNEALTSKAASIKNELIDVIGEQTYSMLKSTDGKTKLADEIIVRLNKLLNTDVINEVYYEEYFVQ